MRPRKGGPQLPAPFEIWPFSPGFLNYFLDAPCSMDIFAACSLLPGYFGPHFPGSLKPLTMHLNLNNACMFQ